MGNHKQIFQLFIGALSILFAGLILAACAVQTPAQGNLALTIQSDGKLIPLEVPAGSTVQTVLDKAGITLGALDRIEPPTFTLLTGATPIIVTRVQEVFEVEETTLPFSRQTVKNESLPSSQRMIVQAGEPGVLQVTYRRLFENQVEVSRTRIKSVTVTEPKPEIEMVGVQTPFAPVSLPRKLVYLTMGSAWMMQRSSAERSPLITSGDLDGRIFSLSPDGKWLLFTRKSSLPAAEEINSLWIVSTTDENPKPIDLKVKNIVHYAEWSPTTVNTIYYSTVEPRESAPGWQANNDLFSLVFSAASSYVKKEEIIQANSGGVYGWWGTNYSWSGDGKRLAYARPDSIGLVNFEKKTFTPLLDLLPYQTRSDWAWVPGISWSADHRVIYLVDHLPQAGLASKENSQSFDMVGFLPDTHQSITLSSQTGMFAYPTISPILNNKRAWVAFLKAYFPEQSETSRYRLYLVEQDGSNIRAIFPDEGAAGLEPQQVVWSPLTNSETPLWLGAIYRGNIHIVDPTTGKVVQITGDGLIKRMDWK